MVLLRSDNAPDVAIAATQWEICDLQKLEQHIRTLQAARKWLIEQQKNKAVKSK